MSLSTEQIIQSVSRALVAAGSSFREDKINAYNHAIEKESNPQAKWVMETILENAAAAKKNSSPLCDDSGIPHIVLEIGDDVAVTGAMLEAVKKGVAQGLRSLPGRPMGICGDDIQRIDQSGGLDPDPAGVEAAPFLIRHTKDNAFRVHIMMFGGGPAIRAKTYRVFHKHNADTVFDEIIAWGKESVAQLGCSPCTLAVGIGRSHFEAASLMVEALVEGSYDIQSEPEKCITDAVNKADIGALGLHGDTSVLATFMKVGPQRASGVRVVCMRPCCCFEPRIATVDLLNPDVIY